MPQGATTGRLSIALFLEALVSLFFANSKRLVCLLDQGSDYESVRSLV